MPEFDHTDRDTLIELYHRQDLRQIEVGELCGVSGTTIKRWMERLDIDTRKPRPQDVVRDIRSLGDGKPTQDEYRNHGQHSVNAVKNRFGSWSEGLVAAGYEPRSTSVSQEELLDDLRDLAEELGRSPSQQDINEHSMHSHKSYYRHFDDGMQEAKEQAGLQTYEQWSKNRITVTCANCGAERKKTPSALAASDYHYCSQDCHYEHNAVRYSGDGNPQSTLEDVPCEACGKTISRPKWKREKNERHYCADCWGDAKVPIECEQCGEVEPVWPSIADKRRFCSYDCMGEWRGEEITDEDHPRWRKNNYTGYYGPNWATQRRKAIIRDQARCQDCEFTEAESMTQFGEGLSIHHITPISEFVDDATLDFVDANQLDNLVSLCRPCHSKRETEVENHGY